MITQAVASELATLSTTTAHGYAFGEFQVDLRVRKLSRNDSVMQLPSRAFDALVYLIEHRERLVQKEEIISAIWHDVVVTDDSLIHAISVLRRALGDERRHPTYIETVPRRGYRFVGAVQSLAHSATRASDAADATAADLVVAPPAAAPSGQTPRTGFPVFAWAAAAAAVAIFGAVVVTAMSRPSTSIDDTSALRLSQPAPPGTTLVSSGVLSPNGRYLAFVARDDTLGQTALWVRALYSDKLDKLPRTDGAAKPFWAPDSQRIGFIANGNLLTTSLTSERPRVVATVGIAAGGGSWGSDDTILFVADWAAGVHAVHASGSGEIAAVVEVDSRARDIAYAWPQFLPGGQHFLYQVVSLDPERSGAYIGNLATGESVRVLETASPAVFAPPRYLLHVEKDLLIAEELDLARLELTGRAIVVARGVSVPTVATENVVSAADDTLAFRHSVHKQNLAWVDRAGESLRTLSVPTVLFNPRLSPDGSRLLATSSVTTDPGLWLASLSRDEYARLEKDGIAPLWSPDGRRVAFTAGRGTDLLIRPVDEHEAARLLITDSAVKILNDWAPDGTHFVYTKIDDRARPDLWVAEIESGAARPLLATPASELQARISPDGHWIAYSSDESGTLEVYVQRYPNLGDKRRISTAGGGQPQWRADQRELFYLAADRSLMSVEVATGETIAFGAPRKLFRPSISADPADARDHYAASADGTRFLIDGAVRDGNDAAITVMVNWRVKTSDRLDNVARGESVSQLTR